MTAMTPQLADAVWSAIDDQRRRTAALLDGLSEDQWDHTSLCDGWTVRHVATHLTLQRHHVTDVAAFVARNPSVLRRLSLNATIHHSALIQSRLPTAEIISRIRAGIGSRRHNFFVSPLETLTDILVHSQDIAVPLGLDLTMDPSASELAATRRWDTRNSMLSKVYGTPPLDGYRLVATDVGWERGEGREVAGPMGALLLLITGRSAALRQLTGEGADVLRSAAATPG
ncbi:maleylpyruvate isomerase family mycothiol-dependent enzyme [Humibacillus xanthopallidus]|uniref:maleylpyruvate isomerase family mycothiol-dependent enzyme n=1 Tax=Humibacillus xanthopallidus TaxID=412689 RepID=UPI00384AA2B1